MAFAIAAVAGFAGASSCNDPCGEACPFGYRVKVMVRTTGSCNAINTAKTACDECNMASFRGPVIRKFVGVVYGTTATEAGVCGDNGCACNDWKDTASIAFFDYDTNRPLALDAGTTELIQLNRIGCKAEDRAKAEMAFTVGFACGENVAKMTFAGFGLCGNHDGKITIGAISGYCAGQLPASTTVASGSPCVDPTVDCGNMVWNICCNTYYKCAYTAAYGKWTFVWDAGMASKVGSNLTATAARTGWGTAVPVAFKDARACSDVTCDTCSDK